LKIDVLFPKKYESANFEVVAEIVWKKVSVDRRGKGFQYGLRFVQILEEDSRKLKDLLSDRSASEDLSDHLWNKFESEVREKMEPTKVVVRYANGAITKGFIQNFFPNEDFFYLTRADHSSGPPIDVSVKRLKAVFVVRDFRGNPPFEERNFYLEGENPPCLKPEVTFAAITFTPE